jgi:hypothetical protein
MWKAAVNSKTREYCPYRLHLRRGTDYGILVVMVRVCDAFAEHVSRGPGRGSFFIAAVDAVLSFPRVRRVEICKTPDQEENERTRKSAAFNYTPFQTQTTATV